MRKLSLLLGAIALAAGALVVAPSSVDAGGPIVVDVLNDLVDDNGDCSLREAVNARNGEGPALTDACGASSSVIDLPAGTITITTDGADDDNEEGDFDLMADVTIRGKGAGVTIIDGDDMDRIFDTDDEIDLVLEDLTLQNGEEEEGDDGGAVSASGDLTARRVHFLDNEVKGDDADGGAIDADAVTIIENSVLRGNKAFDDGGAIKMDSGSDLTVSKSTFDDNSAGGDSGAFDAGGDTHAVSHSTFSNNHADDDGGAINEEGGDDQTVTVVNSTFSGNTADGAGSSLHVANGMVYNLSYVTIVGADPESSSIHVNDGVLHVDNTIIADSGEGTCSFDGSSTELNSAGGNIESPTDLCGLDETTDKPGTADVMLGALADNGGGTLTHLPQPGSPAIDMAAGECVADDQRMVARPIDGDEDGTAVCDIGAVEAEPPAEEPVDPTDPPDAKPAEAVQEQPDFTG